MVEIQPLCTYHLLPCGLTPRTSPGTQGGWYSFGISFFPEGKGSYLVLETTSLDHRDIRMGFVRDSATAKVKSVLPGTMVDV